MPHEHIVKNGLIVDGPLEIKGAASYTGNLTLGSTSGGSSTTPLNINMGGTFSSVAGANPKITIYNSTVAGDIWGFGVSSNQLDYIVPNASNSHNFYVAGTKYASISNSGLNVTGNLDITNAATHNRFQKGTSWVNPRDPWDNFHLRAGIGNMYFDSPTYYIRNGDGGATYVTIDNTGVAVNGKGHFTGTGRFIDNNGAQVLLLTNNVDSDISFRLSTGGAATKFASLQVFNNLNFRIQPDGGNVLIGKTADDGSKLQVNGNLTLGNTTSVAVASPITIDMGGTHSNAAAANLKLKLYNEPGGTVLGLGVSNGQLDYVVPVNHSHSFYVAGVRRTYIDASGLTAAESVVASGGNDGAWGSARLYNGTSWNGTTKYPTVGSSGGSTGSLIMLDNPHTTLLSTNARPGKTQRSGLRMAAATNGGMWWDMGLTGDEFEIYRYNGSSGLQFIHITNTGNISLPNTTNLSLGNTSSVATATPITIDMGGTHSNAAGANLKLKLWTNGTVSYGLGISSGQLDYAVPGSTDKHGFFVGGTKVVEITNSGLVGITPIYPTANNGVVWSTTTQGKGQGSIHFRPNGTYDAGNAITWGGQDGNQDNAMAGIYVKASGSYGTRMYLSTSDSYVDGAKTAMTILENGNISLAKTLTVGGTSTFTGVVFPIANNSTNWSTTAQGHTKGGIHLTHSGTYDTGNAITWGGTDGHENNAQAGVYVKASGSYGTRMYFSTTNSFASGPQTAMWIDVDRSVKMNNGLSVSGTLGVGSAALNYKIVNGGADQIQPFSVAPSAGTGRFGVDFNSVGSDIGVNYSVVNAGGSLIRYAAIIGVSPSNATGAETGTLRFATKPSGSGVQEAMRIDENQRLLIGYTASQASFKVQVNGGLYVSGVSEYLASAPMYFYTSGNTDSRGLRLGTNGNDGEVWALNQLQLRGPSGVIFGSASYVDSSRTEYGRITSAGLLLGRTSDGGAGYKLHVSGSALINVSDGGNGSGGTMLIHGQGNSMPLDVQQTHGNGYTAMTIGRFRATNSNFGDYGKLNISYQRDNRIHGIAFRGYSFGTSFYAGSHPGGPGGGDGATVPGEFIFETRASATNPISLAYSVGGLTNLPFQIYKDGIVRLPYNGDFGELAPVSSTTLTATTGGTLAAQTYFVRVVAVDSTGTSHNTVESSVAVASPNNAVSVSWPAVTGAASYRIYVGTASLAQDRYFTSTGTTFTITAYGTGDGSTTGTVPPANTTYGTRLGFSTNIFRGTITAKGSTNVSTSERFGAGSDATGPNSTAIGNGALASVNGAVVLGSASKADSGQYGTAIGYSSYAGNTSTALGGFANANGAGTAIGYNAVATDRNIAIGGNAGSFAFSTAIMGTTNSQFSIAMGYESVTSHNYTIALGRGATTTAANQMVVGSATYPMNFVLPSGNITVTGAGTFSGNLSTNADLYFTRAGVNSSYISMYISGDNSGLMFFTRHGSVKKSMSIEQDTIYIDHANAGGVIIGGTTAVSGNKLNVNGNTYVAGKLEAYLGSNGGGVHKITHLNSGNQGSAFIIDTENGDYTFRNNGLTFEVPSGSFSDARITLTRGRSDYHAGLVFANTGTASTSAPNWFLGLNPVYGSGGSHDFSLWGHDGTSFKRWFSLNPGLAVPTLDINAPIRANSQSLIYASQTNATTFTVGANEVAGHPLYTIRFNYYEGTGFKHALSIGRSNAGGGGTLSDSVLMVSGQGGDILGGKAMVDIRLSQNHLAHRYGLRSHMSLDTANINGQATAGYFFTDFSVANSNDFHAYGIYTKATHGSNANQAWAIYSDGGLNYFNGNVLIGTTTNGGAKLQVAGNANFQVGGGTGSFIVQQSSLDSTGLFFQVKQQNGNNAIQVDGSGVVYLQRTSVTDIYNTGTDRGRIQINAVGGGSADGLVNISGGLASPILVVRQTAAHASNLFEARGSANTALCSISSTGAVTASSYYQSSSRELKTEIDTYKEDAVSLIKGVEVVTFKYKTDLEHERVGFIAEDTHERFSTKNRNVMDTNSTIGILLKAVQELNAKIVELENRLNGI